jgi:glyoxylase-like metal-dependent hydrolase (beta-lactamase superfamily II)
MIQPFDFGEVRFFRMARTYWGRAIYWTGIYHVDGLLIDSGPANLAPEVLAILRELPVRQAVTTHHHEDHSGNNSLLQDQLRITPFAHASGVPLLAERVPRLRAYRRAAWGVPSPCGAQPVGDWIETPRFRFRVLHTPGHSEDHIALHEPEQGWLFSGDLFLSSRLKYLRSDEDVHLLVDSLRRVLSLEPHVLFCQHRGRVEQGATLLRRKLDFLVELGERVAELSGGGLPDREIARALPWSDWVWRLRSGGEFSKLNFVRAYLKRPPAE